MDLTPMHKRVIALDVHQAKITACAVVEHEDGRVEVTKRDLRDRGGLSGPCPAQVLRPARGQPEPDRRGLSLLPS